MGCDITPLPFAVLRRSARAPCAGSAAAPQPPSGRALGGPPRGPTGRIETAGSLAWVDHRESSSRDRSRDMSRSTISSRDSSISKARLQQAREPVPVISHTTTFLLPPESSAPPAHFPIESPSHSLRSRKSQQNQRDTIATPSGCAVSLGQCPVKPGPGFESALAGSSRALIGRWAMLRDRARRGRGALGRWLRARSGLVERGCRQARHGTRARGASPGLVASRSSEASRDRSRSWSRDWSQSQVRASQPQRWTTLEQVRSRQRRCRVGNYSGNYPGTDPGNSVCHGPPFRKQRGRVAVAWMRMMGVESVAYHRSTVMDRSDDHPGAAVAVLQLPGRVAVAVGRGRSGPSRSGGDGHP